MRDPVKFWQTATFVLPIVGLIVPISIAKILGGFGPGFEFVGQNLSPLEAFGLVGAMCFPFAGYQFARTKQERAQAQASQSWPTAPARIRTSDFLWVTGGYANSYYRARARYTYRVGGTDYEGDRVFFGPRRISDARVVDQVAPKYPPDASAIVHYDPEDPTVAVLETAADLGASRNFNIAILLAAPPIAAVLVAIVGR
ncbi:MAG TPA: DUF3592 domain-containing protein [Reyranella sp.]|nr:DUF3592 domain-containing protein [Reyranella sp.]